MKELTLQLGIRGFKNKDDILKYINYHLEDIEECEKDLIYSDFDDDHVFTLFIKEKE